MRPAGVLLTLILAALCASPSSAQFETRSSVSVGLNVPISAVAADFNRDGILDLAEVNYLAPSSVEILLGKGDGTFRVGGIYPVGVQPFYAATASFRGSGILDLVVGDTLSDNVYVMLGNGDGTFQPPVSYPITARSQMVGVGDFTGGGKIDVLALEGYNCYCLEVLPGNGDAVKTTRAVVVLTGPMTRAGQALSRWR